MNSEQYQKSYERKFSIFVYNAGDRVWVCNACNTEISSIDELVWNGVSVTILTVL
jgi:hypothetical protein